MNKVSLYLAAGSNIQRARSLAHREMDVTSNVRNKWTRNEVTAAWRNILRHLDGLKKVPPNGLVLFADSSGVEAVEPPVPCPSNIYRCGSDFFREPLDVLRDEAAGPKTGLVLIDTNEATVAWFRGETWISLWHDFSGIMGKHGAGGQSQRRFERGHEEQRKQWWRKVADVANQSFLALGIADVIAAGPGFIKHDMLEDHILDYRLRVVAVVDAEYVDDVAGPREALARWRQSQDQ